MKDINDLDKNPQRTGPDPITWNPKTFMLIWMNRMSYAIFRFD